MLGPGHAPRAHMSMICPASQPALREAEQGLVMVRNPVLGVASPPPTGAPPSPATSATAAPPVPTPLSARNLLHSLGGSLRAVITRRKTAVDIAALNEHAILATSCSPLSVLRSEYGRGIMAYFFFLQYTIVWNALLVVLALITFGMAWPDIRLKTSASAAFIGLFPARVRQAWLGTTIAMLIIAFAAAWVYPAVHRVFVMGGGGASGDAIRSMLSRRRRGRGSRGSSVGGIADCPELAAGADEEGGGGDGVEDMASATDMREDIASRSMTSNERRTRRLLSFVVFATIIAGQAVITYAVFVGLSLDGGPTLSLIIALVNNVLNYVNKQISKQLTVFERHTKTTSHRESDTLKLFVLKFVNVVILYILRAFVAQAAVDAGPVGVDSPDATSLTCPFNATTVAAGGSPTSPGDRATCDCPLLAQGWTFLWLILFDVAFSVVVEPLIAVAYQRYRKCMANRHHLSDYDTRLDFDVSEEMVAVLYRQFLVLLGAPVFPLITALGLVAYVIEYYMDRVKLVNLCKKTILKEEALDMRLVLACSLLVSIAAAVMYPQGLLFVAMRTNLASCTFLAD